MKEAGATSVNGIALHLRGAVKEVFTSWLREQRPDLLERYGELYGRGAYAPKPERERLARLVRDRGGARRSARWLEVPSGTQVAPEGAAPKRQRSLF